jgi:diguanylate cyclase (GGDEF)-like protein/PAS domain S-box-containing protein
MSQVPQLAEAARYIDGVVFVLRQEHGDRFVLERASGTLGPLVFADAGLNQATFETALANMSQPRRAVFFQKARDVFSRRGEIEEFIDLEVGDLILNAEVRGEVTENEAGVFLAGFIRDRTESERLGAQREMQAALSTAVRVFPDMVWLKDAAGRYVLCNDMFDRFNRVPSAQLIGKTAKETEQGKNARIHDTTDMQALQSSEIVAFEHVVAEGEDGPRFFDVRKLALRDEDGSAIGILGTARETTAWRRLETELRQSELCYRSLADNIPDRLIRFGRDRKYLHTNRSMREFFQTVDYPTPDDLVSRDVSGQPNGRTAMEIMAAVERVQETGEALTIEARFVNRNDEHFTHEIRFFPEFGPDGIVDSVLGIGRDVTARKQMEERLARSEAELHALAFKDSLTGLHNRRSFQTILQSVLNEARKAKTLSALLLLDIDRFKYVNDTLGHAVGDELIVVFAQRLVSVVGEAGHVSRLGGDEFAIILPVLNDHQDAEDISARIHAALFAPIRVSIDSISITTSIGIAYGIGDTDDQNELFRFADMALYAAKSGGRARTTLYDSSMARVAERRFELEALISEGLRNDEFRTYFQHKTDLQTGRINGAEALCRWVRPDSRFISPAEFIPISEETGQIIEIGRRVLLDACRFAARINAGRAVPLPVSVNVSARQLLFGGFIGTLGACLDETGCQSGWIELEITESLLLGDDIAISETLEEIVRLGISLTIDDFGTGYSSLSYIARFPITTLKIDQAFVRDLTSGSKSAVLCRAIISMAQGLGLKTVAEGIETQDIADRLKSLGCTSGQGYLWSRPEPADRALEPILGQDQHGGQPALAAG